MIVRFDVFENFLVTSSETNGTRSTNTTKLIGEDSS
jgi:hypothetical protein